MQPAFPSALILKDAVERWHQHALQNERIGPSFLSQPLPDLKLKIQNVAAQLRSPYQFHADPLLNRIDLLLSNGIDRDAFLALMKDIHAATAPLAAVQEARIPPPVLPTLNEPREPLPETKEQGSSATIVYRGSNDADYVDARVIEGFRTAVRTGSLAEVISGLEYIPLFTLNGQELSGLFMEALIAPTKDTVAALVKHPSFSNLNPGAMCAFILQTIKDRKFDWIPCLCTTESFKSMFSGHLRAIAQALENTGQNDLIGLVNAQITHAEQTERLPRNRNTH